MSSEFYESTERRTLLAMRKTLAKIIKELTPSDSALQYPLSDETVEDIKVCLELISSRERELAQEAGINNQARPRFVDEQQTNNVVSIGSLKNKD